MLVDSNILIYAAQPVHAQLRRFIADRAPVVSAVSYVEVLGYHQLDDEERQYVEEFFRLAQVLPLSQAVLIRPWHCANSGRCPSAMRSWQARRWCID